MFLLNSKNIITILLYSEILWVILYSYTAVTGTINDDLILTSSSFFLLALAGLEFCIGFLIIILFGSLKKSFNLDTTTQHQEIKPIKEPSLNRTVWNFKK